MIWRSQTLREKNKYSLFKVKFLIVSKFGVFKIKHRKIVNGCPENILTFFCQTCFLSQFSVYFFKFCHKLTLLSLLSHCHYLSLLLLLLLMLLLSLLLLLPLLSILSLLAQLLLRCVVYSEPILCIFFRRRIKLIHIFSHLILNTDYKILSRVLTGRTRLVLPEVITSRQLATPGRDIMEGVHCLLSTIAFVERRFLEGGQYAALLALYDMVKAFDRIHVAYLNIVMDHMNFPKEFRSWTEELFFPSTMRFHYRHQSMYQPIIVCQMSACGWQLALTVSLVAGQHLQLLTVL